MTKKYEITFLWPSGDWTWTHILAEDFHEAMLRGLIACPDGCRVLRIEDLHAWKPDETVSS